MSLWAFFYGRDSELGMCELVCANPRCSCQGHGVTLELWKPCLPQTPVFWLWLGDRFISTTKHKA